MKLNEIQNLFLQTCLHKTKAWEELKPCFDPSLNLSKRMGVYKKNVYLIHKRGLTLTYPSLKRFLGEDSFDQLCFEYFLNYPSPEANLNAYGQSLATMLETDDRDSDISPDSQDRDHLTSLARWDWTCHALYHQLEHPTSWFLNAGCARIQTALDPYTFELQPGDHLLYIGQPQMDSSEDVLSLELSPTQSTLLDLIEQESWQTLNQWQQSLNPPQHQEVQTLLKDHAHFFKLAPAATA